MALVIEQEGRRRTSHESSQVFNPQTGHYVKRDAKTGLFVAAKQDGKPFEGINIERASSLPKHPKLSKALAAKIEKAFLKVNSRNI